MKPIEIVQSMREAQPEVFGSMKDQRAAGIVRGVLHHLAQTLQGAPVGRLLVPGLGVFVVREVEVEKDGVKSTQRRVVYRAPKPGAAGAEQPADEGAEKSAS